jgi:putative salt-induced outer membrane protein YdiY
MSHNKLVWVCIGLFLHCSHTTSVQADKVILSNRDVLHGKVVSLSEGKLQFESAPLGKLTIAIDKVQSLQTESEVTVILQDSPEPLWVRVVEADEGIQLKSTDPAKLVRLQDIEALGTVADRIVNGEAKQFQWKGNFEAGLSGRSGNTQRMATNGRFDLEARNPDWIFKGYFRALIAEQEIKGETQRTDHEIKGGGRIQRTLTDGLTLYLQQELERDKIEELRLRSITNGGLGMRWLENKQWFYETRFGVGCQHERFDNGLTSRSVIGELTSDLSYKVNDHIHLTQLTAWLPDLADTDSYRITAETAAVIYLDKAHKLYLKSGLKHDYDSQPLRQVERLDTHYFTNIGYSF